MKWYDKEWGWGDITAFGEGFIIVRFDADPWTLKTIYV